MFFLMTLLSKACGWVGWTQEGQQEGDCNIWLAQDDEWLRWQWWPGHGKESGLVYFGGDGGSGICWWIDSLMGERDESRMIQTPLASDENDCGWSRFGRRSGAWCISCSLKDVCGAPRQSQWVGCSSQKSLGWIQLWEPVAEYRWYLKC